MNFALFSLILSRRFSSFLSSFLEIFSLSRPKIRPRGQRKGRAFNIYIYIYCIINLIFPIFFFPILYIYLFLIFLSNRTFPTQKCVISMSQGVKIFPYLCSLLVKTICSFCQKLCSFITSLRVLN